IIVGWFPEQWADLHELQGSEQKTHECYLSFGPDPVTGRPLTWSRARLVAGVDPAWYARSSAAPYLSPAAAGSAGGYQASVNLAIDGNDTFHAKRERVDEYGWRHFGDIYGDHEAAFSTKPAALVSHYNNQYDAVAGFACQFMRTGDVRWWTHLEELAAD